MKIYRWPIKHFKGTKNKMILKFYILNIYFGWYRIPISKLFEYVSILSVPFFTLYFENWLKTDKTLTNPVL